MSPLHLCCVAIFVLEEVLKHANVKHESVNAPPRSVNPAKWEIRSAFEYLICRHDLSSSTLINLFDSDTVHS